MDFLYGYIFITNMQISDVIRHSTGAPLVM